MESTLGAVRAGLVVYTTSRFRGTNCCMINVIALFARTLGESSLIRRRLRRDKISSVLALRAGQHCLSYEYDRLSRLAGPYDGLSSQV